MRVSLAVAAALLLSSCSDGNRVDPAIAAAVKKSLSSRLTPIADYKIAGTVENAGTGDKLGFTFALKQPGFMAATIGPPGGAAARTFRFDGKRLSIADTGGGSDVRDLSTLDDEARVLAIHDVFSDFTCEGWRPPLLKPAGMIAREIEGKWQVSIPIEDASVVEQRVVLRASDGAFVEKSLIDKAGVAVSTTRVVEEWTDPATKLVFPKAWERVDPSGRYRVSLTDIAVNAGMLPEAFAVEERR